MSVFSLNIFVRYSNLNLILLPPLLFISILLIFEKGNNNNKKLITLGFLLTLLSIISLIPNSIFYYYYYGSFIPKPSLIYDKPFWLESFTIFEIAMTLVKRIPYVFKILFTSEMGLVYTNPIIPIGFCCGIYLISKNIGQSIDTKAFSAILIGLIFCFFGFGISLHLWWQGMASSYGYRYLLEVIPVSILFIFFFFKVSKYLNPKLFRYSKFILIITSIISIVSMVFFSSTPKLKLSQKINTFNVEKSYSGNGYMLDLAEEIIKPYTWLRVISKGPIGLIASPLILKNDVIKKSIINDHQEDFQKYYSRSKSLTTNIFIQIIILFLFWVSFGYKLDLINIANINKKI